MFALVLLAASAAFGQQASTAPAAPRVGAAAPLERALEAVRADSDDLDVRPGRWDTLMTVDAIEELLSDPIALPERSSEWRAALARAPGLSSMTALAGELLDLPTEPPAAVVEVSSVAPAGLAPAVYAAVAGLAAAVARARPFLDMAAMGLSVPERERLLRGVASQVRHVPPEPVDPALFELASRFDIAALLQAARTVAEAADGAAASLAGLPVPAGLPRTLVLAGSTVTLGGTGGDEYAQEDLDRSSILIDFGGANRYLGPPAAAGPGEIKVVIDLSTAAVIDSSGPVASGRFGIGVLLLPSAKGAKRLRGGDLSMGAGLFGAGFLVARGSGTRIESGDFSQGAGAFGVGVMDVEGAAGSLTASMAAQGFGFTRGVGLFRLRGDGARLACGLVYPDARDPLAALSLCQGVGYGPRAFAAGGFGLAFVASDRAQVDANYFAQGAGYWHGFGGFYFTGSGSRIQSRRYGQGAGVHTAMGAFELDGDDDRVLHWGVGPGFGWDLGVGWARVHGDRDQLYADWASGRGDVNGHGLLLVSGREARLQLGEVGTGALKRSAPSYGIAAVVGSATLKLPNVSSAAAMGAVFQPSLWGVVEASGAVVLDPALALEPPRWPNMDRERAAQAWADRESNAQRLAEADAKPAAPERLAGWLFSSAEGGLDGATPGEALKRLMSLSPGHAELLPALAAPSRFEEFVYLRTVFAAYGPRGAKALTKEFESAGGLRKALLMSLFRTTTAQDGLKAATKALKDPDWRVRREALGALGFLFDREGGEEPGRAPFLESALELCRRPAPAAPVPQKTLDAIGLKRPADLLAALALSPDYDAADRLAIVDKTPNPFDPVGPDALQAFARVLGSRPKSCRKALERELKDLRRLEAKARERLVEAADDAEPDLLPVALASLGQLGGVRDAARLARALGDEAAAVAEAAAVGLARMGAAAGPAVSGALADRSPAMRQMGAAAAAQSSDASVFRLLHRALNDADENVRRTAVAGLFAAQAPLRPLRKEFFPDLERLAASDPSPGLRAAAAYAERSF